MWYRLITRRVSVVGGHDPKDPAFEVSGQITVVGGHDPKDPAFEVSGQITVVGDKGYFDSVHGKGFYELMRQSGKEIMATLGIKTLEGYVLPAHARLMRVALAGVGEVRALHRGSVAGHEAIWIQVTPTESEADITIDSGAARAHHS